MSKIKDKNIWRILRTGDKCIVNRMGVEIRGIVDRIIRLSNGKVFIRVVDYSNESVGLFDASTVIPSDKKMVLSGKTSYELLLLKYEPKGMGVSCS